MARDNLYWASFCLRIGLAFTLIYAGISIFVNPESWTGFIPQFIRDISGNGNSSLFAHAVFDMILGIWLLFNWRVFWPAALTALNIFFITIFNLGAIEIVFRDVGLLFAALALLILNWKNR